MTSEFKTQVHTYPEKPEEFRYRFEDVDVDRFLAADPLEGWPFDILWEIFEKQCVEQAQLILDVRRWYRDVKVPGRVLDLDELKALDGLLEAARNVIWGNPFYEFHAHPVVQAKAAELLQAFRSSRNSLVELRGMDEMWWDYYDPLRLGWNIPDGQWTLELIQNHMLADLAREVRVLYSLVSHMRTQLQRLSNHEFGPDSVEMALRVIDEGPSFLRKDPLFRLSKASWDRFHSLAKRFTVRQKNLARLDRLIRKLGYRKNIPLSITDPVERRAAFRQARFKRDRHISESTSEVQRPISIELQQKLIQLIQKPARRIVRQLAMAS